MYLKEMRNINLSLFKESNATIRKIELERSEILRKTEVELLDLDDAYIRTREWEVLWVLFLKYSKVFLNRFWEFLYTVVWLILIFLTIYLLITLYFLIDYWTIWYYVK